MPSVAELQKYEQVRKKIILLEKCDNQAASAESRVLNENETSLNLSVENMKIVLFAVQTDQTRLASCVRAV